jgi:hypothetical protein
MVGDGTEPDTLSSTKVEELRAHLVTTACDGTTPLRLPGGPAMATRIGEQVAAWDQVVVATDTTTGGAATALGELETATDGVESQIDLLRSSVQRDSGEVVGRLRGVEGDRRRLGRGALRLLGLHGRARRQGTAQHDGGEPEGRQAATRPDHDSGHFADPMWKV